MINNKKLLILPVFLLLFAASIYAACTVTTVNDGTDYFGVNTAVPNTTVMQSYQTFYAYTAFTPRLNTTVVVTDTFTANTSGNLSYFNWKTPINFSTSLVLKNGSTTIGAGNYTLINRVNNGWAINWTSTTFTGNTITATFNRTFIKNVEDLVTNASAIYTGATTSSFLTLVQPTGAGQTASFEFTDGLGSYLNNTNWAVTWNYGNQSCVNIDTATTTGISNTKSLAYAGFALIAVMLLVMAGWAIIQLFQGGSSMGLMEVATVIIGGGIVISIAYIIIFFVAQALGG